MAERTALTERTAIALVATASAVVLFVGVMAEQRALAAKRSATHASTSGGPATATSNSNAAASTGAAPSGHFAIVDARVFDGERVHDRATVVVRDGRIEAMGEGLAVPDGVARIDGAGKTLLPGLIDAHTHVFGDALERALQFGVTTELDMFTDHRLAARLRDEQSAAPGVTTRADLRSSGTLVTAPGGHGTEYGLPIPTLATPREAAAFVDARVAEGSDYIKLVYDDGTVYGLKFPTLDRATLEAAIGAAHARQKLALVHVGRYDAAVEAIDAGADGLVHVFADRDGERDFVAKVAAHKAFVVPTLTVVESTAGVPSGKSLVEDARVSAFLAPAERANLGASFPRRASMARSLAVAIGVTRALYQAGVPILAGSDAPNPGTAHGVSLHRELELLVTAGLSPVAALAAATAKPARVFGLADRGRIAPGLRADLVLVEGDPTRDVTNTRAIAHIWKGGAAVLRTPMPQGTASDPAGRVTDGAVSSFDGGVLEAAFGAGWMVSTDSMMGGKSTARADVVAGGAGGSSHALEVAGSIVEGAPYPWAGAMFSPGRAAMQPADLSAFEALTFWARGDGATYRVLVFSEGHGAIPVEATFTAGPEWRAHTVTFSSLGVDARGLRGVLFSAAPGQREFKFRIDDVRFR